MQQGRQGDFGSSTSKAGKPCMASVLRVSSSRFAIGCILSTLGQRSKEGNYLKVSQMICLSLFTTSLES